MSLGAVRHTTTTRPRSATPAPITIDVSEAPTDHLNLQSFATDLWNVAILGSSLFYLTWVGANTLTALPFSSLTFFTVMLSYFSRSGIVSTPYLTATAGVFGLAVVVSYWTLFGLVGHDGLWSSTPTYLWFRDLVFHVALPLDAFAIAVVRNAYRSYVGVWYTLAFATLYICFALFSEPYYPFLQSWDLGMRTGLFLGGGVGGVVGHVLLVNLVRSVQ